MAFPESIKDEARNLAHYKCCICESFKFTEVHHITPESEGGPDILDNAVPLCVDCHDTYGHTPDKRKWIKNKRNFYYDYCKNKLYNEDLNKLAEISIRLVKFEESFENGMKELKTIKPEMEFFKQQMGYFLNKNQELYTQLLSQPNKEKEQSLYAEIRSNGTAVNNMAFIASGARLLSNIEGSYDGYDGYYPGRKCPNCHKRIPSQMEFSSPFSCPNCGTPF